MIESFWKKCLKCDRQCPDLLGMDKTLELTLAAWTGIPSFYEKVNVNRVGRKAVRPWSN